MNKLEHLIELWLFQVQIQEQTALVRCEISVLPPKLEPDICVSLAHQGQPWEFFTTLWSHLGHFYFFVRLPPVNAADGGSMQTALLCREIAVKGAGA